MWGSGHTYCFRPHHGYDSQSYLTEMVELANAFCEGWEGQTGNSTSQLNSIAETFEDEKQCFSGCPSPAKTSGDQSLTGQAFHAWDSHYSHHCAWQIAYIQLWAAACGDSQMSTQCLASLQRSQSHPVSREEHRGLSSVLDHKDSHREPSFPWKELQKRRGLAQQYVKGSVFPAIFMSLHKKEIRN